MYYLNLLLFTILFVFAFQMPDHHSSKWLITKGGSLKVEGSTNVSKFSCVISTSLHPDTLRIRRSMDNELTNIQGKMNLDVRGFDCHNSMMTKDLRKTLKAKEFPRMVIRFISLSQYPENRSKPYPISGIVNIELAGVSKKFDVAYMVLPSGKNMMVLKGVRELKFSDFNIVPPRKIGGMIKTNDKLVAEFNLTLQLLTN